MTVSSAHAQRRRTEALVWLRRQRRWEQRLAVLERAAPPVRQKRPAC